jgi:CheY-like chemotaxis protein
MTRRVLWLDNDVAQTAPYVAALKRSGHSVTVVKSISACEELLIAASTAMRYDLLILDVMVPTKDAAEEEIYTPELTERGTVTGLAFWQRWASRLADMGTRVLALTVRLDRPIKDQFVKAGLPKESFSTKLELRDTDDFVNRVELITSDGR